MKRLIYCGLWSVAIGVLIACAPIATPTILAPSITPSAPPLLPIPTSSVAAVPRSTRQPIEVAVAAMKHALEVQDASALQSLMLDQIYLAQGPEANIGGLIAQADASAWLNDRWNKNRSIESTDYIEHFEMLEVVISGWSIAAPMQTDRLVFHLHRYNANGQGDALNGRWRIDAILYE